MSVRAFGPCHLLADLVDNHVDRGVDVFRLVAPHIDLTVGRQVDIDAVKMTFRRKRYLRVERRTEVLLQLSDFFARIVLNIFGRIEISKSKRYPHPVLQTEALAALL